MIIYTTNILALPLILLVWAIDLYLLLAGIRLLLSRIRSSRTHSFCLVIRRFTDPLPCAVRQWLSTRQTKPVPNWLPWLIVGAGAVLIRHILILIMFRTH